MSGRLAKIRSMSKSCRSLCVSFSWTDAELCIYHLFVWSNLKFLHISLWITLPTKSCLVLYSFCANLLYSLIMWLMVSSLSSHSLHWLFCCVYSRFDMIGTYGVVLGCYFYYYYYYYYYYFNLLGVFHTSVSWWFLTGVWERERERVNLLNFPGLFSVFLPILKVLLSWWSPLNPFISKSSSSFTNPLRDYNYFVF